MIWHCQLGGLRALVDGDKHKVTIPPWALDDREDRRGTMRPVRDQADAVRLALEWWGQMAYRANEVSVRPATPQDVAIFARMEEVRLALRKPVGVQEALW